MINNNGELHNETSTYYLIVEFQGRTNDSKYWERLGTRSTVKYRLTDQYHYSTYHTGAKENHGSDIRNMFE
jgi:hypothetical protein